jgi:DNA-binding LacI/PurR family transcriptional regulator
MIRQGKLRGGQRVPPVRDLARQHDVSFGAAHAAVKSLEGMGLVERFHGSGTYVRHGLATEHGKSQGSTLGRTLAYLFMDNRPHVHGEMVQLLIDRLQESQVAAVRTSWAAGDSVEKIQYLLEQWADHPPRAIVIQGFDSRLYAAVRRLCPASTRVVTVFRPEVATIPSGWHTVNPDFGAAYTLATQRLLAAGHRRIGLVTKTRRISPDWPSTIRKAYMGHTEYILAAGRTLREAGLHGALTIHYNLPIGQDPSGLPVNEANIERMAKWLSGPNRPTAVIGDDFRMLGVRLAAQRARLRVPEDVQLLGVGGAQIARTAAIPVIALRYDAMAQHVASLVTSPVEGSATQVVVSPVFVDA